MANTNYAVSSHVALHPLTIEKTFTDCVIDLKRILVLDDIDILPGAFRVRSHDLHGQLPEIVMKNSGDTFQDKQRLRYEACKLLAIVRLRNRMVRFLPGCRLLPPTMMDGIAIVGLQSMPRTWIIEGKDFLSAYHELHSLILD